ncbi:MAG: hypothetical protein ACRDRK_16425 [Pseudonocardia sp.]
MAAASGPTSTDPATAASEMSAAAAACIDVAARYLASQPEAVHRALARHRSDKNGHCAGVRQQSRPLAVRDRRERPSRVRADKRRRRVDAWIREVRTGAVIRPARTGDPQPEHRPGRPVPTRMDHQIAPELRTQVPR